MSNTSFYQTFKDNIEHLMQININGNEYLIKILYAHVVTLMEEYLYTTFKETVLKEESTIRMLFEADQFKQIKIPLEVAYSTDLKKIISSYIDNILFHKLNKIDKLYKKTLDIKLQIHKDLTDAVIIRHDIVHRNGKNKDGNPVSIDKSDLDKLINDMDNFVITIDSMVFSKYYSS